METQNRQTPERFFKLLEAGDLSFLDFMMYAIVVFGITKHGKTTFSHHLAGHSLEAYINDDNTVHYRLVRDTDKKSDARIGATMNSQTQIPNKFETNLFEGITPIYLIDNPGQKDSFGINRVISNAYFHYRIFTKIQNMKFILLFDYPTFSGNIKETNEIFNMFFNSFANFKNVKDQLLKSIAFVFTKVKEQISQRDVIERIKGYLEGIEKVHYFQQEKEDFIKKLFNLCIKDEHRIKIFRKAEVGVPIEVNPKLIGQINSSLEFFSRDIVQNDEFESKYYQEKKTSMKDIKFSQTNKIMSLSHNQGEKNQTMKLFNQPSLRGKNMFTALFQTLTQLFNYVLFNKETNGIDSKNKVNQTEVIREKRRKAQKEILQNLAKVNFEHDRAQKYVKRRQEILQRYGQCLKSTQKAQNFMERMVVATQLYNFCLKYTDINFLVSRNQNQINKTRKDFELIIRKVSQFYSGKEEIEILSKFMYELNTLLNQMIIFCIIILPNTEENSNIDPNSNKTSSTDPYLLKFLDCFEFLDKIATNMDGVIVNQMMKEFKIPNQSARKLDQNSIMYHYLKKFPNIIIEQGDRQEKILKSLKQIDLTLEHKIHCQILIFRYLQKKFYFLSELKCFDQKQGKQKMDLMSSSPQQKKEKREKKEQAIQEISQKDIKCLIKSFVIYLKSVKKMKELSQYNEFKSYKTQIYEINYLVWTYLVKLFCLLLEAKDVSDIQKEQCKEILIEVVSSSKNYNLIEQVYEKLLERSRESFEQLTIKSSVRKMSKETEKRIKVLSSDNFKYFLACKKKLSKEIIILTLSYAQLLNDLGLKDKSLTQCYSIMKYTQFSPEQVMNVEDMVRKIKSKNTGFRIEEEFRSVTDFEATIAIKKQLGYFLKQNSQVEQLQCVNYEFIN